MKTTKTTGDRVVAATGWVLWGAIWLALATFVSALAQVCLE